MWTEVVYPLQHNAAWCRNAGASLEAASLCSCVLKSIIQGCFLLSEWKKTDKPVKAISFLCRKWTNLWIRLSAEVRLEQHDLLQIRFTEFSLAFSEFEHGFSVWTWVMHNDLSDHCRKGTVLSLQNAVEQQLLNLHTNRKSVVLVEVNKNFSTCRSILLLWYVSGLLEFVDTKIVHVYPQHWANKSNFYSNGLLFLLFYNNW